MTLKVGTQQQGQGEHAKPMVLGKSSAKMTPILSENPV
jgi:hypothetical protein